MIIRHSVPRGARLLRIAAGILLGWFVCEGCPNPAVPPGPPAELPTALRFPESVSINVDKVRTAPASPGPAAFKAFVGEGKFSKEISFGADFAKVTTDFVDSALGFVTGFEIPVGTATRTFTGTTILEDGTSAEVKIDFADFDLDGDGVAEGCPGHTAGLPVCFRVWVDGVRTLAGRFDAFPTSDNPGAGRFRAASSGDGNDILAGAVYDFHDPNARTAETFLLLRSGAQPPIFDSHASVAQAGPDASAKKLLRTSVEDRGLICSFSGDFTSCGTDLNTVRYTGRWREDNDYWSGSLDNTFGTLENFTDLCAQISNGEESPAGNCRDLEIDVSGVDFIPFTTEEDVAFPSSSDFPPSPPF